MSPLRKVQDAESGPALDRLAEQVQRELAMIDHAADWAIIGDPSGRYLWIMARAPALPTEALEAAMSRVRQLGYDAGRLEFPTARR